MTVSEALRLVTAKLQKELDFGGLSPRIDANDLIDILLEVAELADDVTAQELAPS